jgi:exopolysaccharide production protein ExoQ
MRLRFKEGMFVVFALILFTKPFVDTGLVHDRTGGQQGDYVVWILFLAVYAGALILLGGKQFYESIKKDKLSLSLVILAMLSLLWSEDAGLTFKRAVALMGTVTVGAYLSVSYAQQKVVEYLAWALGVAAVLSVIVVGAWPNQAIMNELHPGAWQGIYDHKNVLGRLMALSAISFLFVGIGSRKHRLIGVLGFLFSSFVVIESASMTALLVLVALLCLIPALLVMRRHPKLVLSAGLAVLLLASMTVWVTDSSHKVLRVFGRDETLTGRVDLWQSAVLVIEKRPWLGHGYGTGWMGEGEDATTDIAAFSHWKTAPSAHNGFLNVTLDLGFAGLVLLILSYVRALYRAIIWFRKNESIWDLWPLLLLSFVLLINLTESMFLRYNSLDWLLYITIILSLAKKTEISNNS